MKIETNIVFTGDIGFDKHMEGRFRDEELIAPELLEFFHSADHVVANVEGAQWRHYFLHEVDKRYSFAEYNNYAQVYELAACMPEGSWRDPRFAKIASYILREFDQR